MKTQRAPTLLRTVAFTTIVVIGGIALATNTAEAKPVMTDQTISDKIDDELWLDPAVVSTNVDVNTSDGIVTLTGKVSNILAKERAARLAETVKGVRAVVNRIEVNQATNRSDTMIRQEIESALHQDPATSSYKVNTTVEDGEVTLTGTLDSHQERELVKIVVKGVRGVKAINDQLDVEYKSNRSDKVIEKEIEEALRWNIYVDNFLIDVDVNSGTVNLSGTVGSSAEKRLAEAAAWVAGVKSVDTSRLNVEKWARDDQMRGNKYAVKTADELRQAVKDALLYDPRVMSFNVDVDVGGSVITLRGQVNNLKAKRAAEQDAKNTVGVSYVVNRLKVRLDNSIRDSDVAENIRAALLRDPYTESYKVTVTVLDGTAHLYGTVDSYFEKNRADDVASRVTGVLDVKNHLVVDSDSSYYHYDPYVDDSYFNGDKIFDYERRAPLMTDSQIKDSIESELWWSPFVDSDDVTVTVNNGVATLTGTVDTWSERQAATENAYEGSATLVYNNLVVTFDD